MWKNNRTEMKIYRTVLGERNLNKAVNKKNQNQNGTKGQPSNRKKNDKTKTLTKSTGKIK